MLYNQGSRRDGGVGGGDRGEQSPGGGAAEEFGEHKTGTRTA